MSFGVHSSAPALCLLHNHPDHDGDSGVSTYHPDASGTIRRRQSAVQPRPLTYPNRAAQNPLILNIVNIHSDISASNSATLTLCSWRDFEMAYEAVHINMN